MTEAIENFHDGVHDFLSNFALEPDGFTNEHFYQAAKVVPGTPKHRIHLIMVAAQELEDGLSKERWTPLHKILGAATAGKAKQAGRRCEMTPDWEDVKVEVMRLLLLRKFAKGTDFAERLLATGDAQLIEGNHWGDRVWGVYKGEGQNLLGKLLMEVRDGLR